MQNKKTIIAFGAHTDDAELGAGGTINKFVEEGHDVYYVAFSSAEASLPQDAPKDTLVKECKRATSKIGIKEENLILYGYPVRTFKDYRQDILDDMIELRKSLHPDIVFLPSTEDTHQDHQVVREEGFRAFKNCTIYGYEELWNNISFPTDCFVKLEKKHIDKKIKAIQEYKSQQGRFYMKPDFTESLAKVRGAQINVLYAETFELIRQIL